eukprot:361739-Chlamydomonas_euryale.AAC.3
MSQCARLHWQSTRRVGALRAINLNNSVATGVGSRAGAGGRGVRVHMRRIVNGRACTLVGCVSMGMQGPASQPRGGG